MENPSLMSLITLGVVILCWLIFAAIFIFRKKPPRQTEAKRDRLSWIGILLQGFAYWSVWLQPPHQPFLPPVAVLSGIFGIIFSVFTIALAIASVWLVGEAVRFLGKQWAFAARLVEDHKLITTGPYAFVRNPIYTGMFGMLIATGLALEHWIGLIVGIILFSIGLVIRIRSEEKLLRAAFGKEFDEYAEKVSAVIPGIY
jgi:protein-S-isoprenylcysteine O-methyltransferase Ste14